VWLMLAYDNEPMCYVLTPCRLDQLSVGALLALAVRGPGGFGSVLPACRWLAPVCLGLVILILATRDSLVAPGRDEILMPTIGWSIVGLGFGAMIVLACAEPPTTLAGRALNAAPLRIMGKYSYAMYIFHPLIMFALAGPFERHVRNALPGGFAVYGAVFVATGIALTVVAAMISWYFWERPFLSLKRYFAY
ncbi:MAG: acyltransferase family protein, partial [Tepidisphaeraceae bacterium]